MTAFIANTNLLDLVGLKAEVGDEFINDAVVTVTIKDLNGVNLSGETWPLTMEYVSGSDGTYRVALVNTLPFLRQTYVAHIDVDAGEDRVGHWEYKFKPVIRR